MAKDMFGVDKDKIPAPAILPDYLIPKSVDSPPKLVPPAATPLPVDTGRDVVSMPIKGDEVKAAPPPPEKPVNAPPPGQDFKKKLEDMIETNSLNKYYQCTYHFRLFLATEVDLAQSAQAKDIGSLLTNMQSVKQVIIAETGITGYNIKDVEIETVLAPNAVTRDQKATTFTMTVTEPMGISFLDALAQSANFLDIKDYTKVNYYLQLSFTGYTEDGRFAGNPIQTGFKNGGQWIWALKIISIDTKVSEGGGVYTLKMLTTDSESVMIEARNYTSPNTMIVAMGNTLGELFTDYQNKLNQAWKDNFTGGTLLQFEIKTHPVPFPPYNGKDPKDFTMQPEKKDMSQIRTMPLGKDASTKKWTFTAAPRMPVGDFITSAIKYSEEGQMLFKNEPIVDKIDVSNTQPNSKNFRVTTLFTIEPITDPVALDRNSGQYIRKVTIHVTPCYTQGVLATRVQMDAAKNPAVQRAMVDSLSNEGYLKKRYEYLFTGQNTEVIDFQIVFNLSWSAILPKLAGKRLGYDNEALAARVSTEGTSSATMPQQDSSLAAENKVDPIPLSKEPKNAPPPSNEAVTAPQPAPGNPPSTAQTGTTVPVGNLGLVKDTITGRIFTPGGGGLAMAPEAAAATQRVQGTSDPPATQLPEVVVTAKRDPPTVTQPVTPTPGQNVIYMEDILTRMAQGQRPDTTVLPVSFEYHFHDTEHNSGSGTSSQKTIGKSVMGMSTQLYNTFELITGAFQKVDLTIRGDPFWIGQSNFERRFALEAGNTHDPKDIPDYSSGAPCIILYFKYPLQIGNDFKPILRDSECFNGIYQVIRVKHNFVDGAFKQNLEAIRLPHINLTDAFTNNSDTVGGSSGSSDNKDAVNGDNKGNTGSTPGSDFSQIAPTGSLPNDAEKVKRAQFSYDFWTNQGYSPAAAAGMVANEEAESGFNWTKPGDNGAAVGAFQWHSDRQQAILAGTGIDVSDPNTTHLQQLQAAFWEQTQGPEKSAGAQVRAAANGGEAGAIASLKYERPANPQATAQIRGGRGAFWQQQFGKSS